MADMLTGATLLTPRDGAAAVARRPTFTWRAVPGAKSYRILVDDDADFTSPLVDQLASTSSAFRLDEPLAPSLRFFWRVVSCSGPMGSGLCALSAAASFRTGSVLEGWLESCADALRQGLVTSGPYELDVDGPGGQAPVEVQCDMTTEGGGWSLVHVASSPNEGGAGAGLKAPYDALLASATEVLVGYRDRSFALSSGWTRFAVPEAWRTRHPLAYSARSETVAISVEGGPPVRTTLHHGTDNWDSAFCLNVGFIPGQPFGLLCFEGTAAPFYSGFAHPISDKCARSDQAFDARPCDVDRVFTIAVR